MFVAQHAGGVWHQVWSMSVLLFFGTPRTLPRFRCVSPYNRTNGARASNEGRCRLALIPIPLEMGRASASVKPLPFPRRWCLPPNGLQVAVQAIDGIRTVSSFNLLDRVMELYTERLLVPLQEGVKRGFVDGALLGLSQFILLGAYGFIFW